CGRTGGAGTSSVHVQEGVQVEDREGELLERLRAKERDGQLLLPRRGRAAGGEPVRELDLRGRVGPGLAAEPVRERAGEVVRERAVEQFQRLEGVRARLPAGATRRRVRLVERPEERQPQVPPGEQVD